MLWQSFRYYRWSPGGSGNNDNDKNKKDNDKDKPKNGTQQPKDATQQTNADSYTFFEGFILISFILKNKNEK